MNSPDRTSYYRILDLNLTVTSDLDRFRRIVDQDYTLFRSDHAGTRESLIFDARFREPDPAISINGREISLAGHTNPISCGYQVLQRAIFESLHDYVVLHAGVIARQGRALVVSGRAGAGKSTLVTSLLKQGFEFFTDDICPVQRGSGLVSPFPRSPWLKPTDPATVQSAQDPDLRAGKVPIDLRQEGFAIGTEPTPISCIICLDPGEKARPMGELGLFLKADGLDPVLADLRAIEDIHRATFEREQSFLHVLYPRGKGIVEKLFRLIRDHDDRIWQVTRGDRVHPDYSGEPTISSLPVDEAAFLLLRELKHGQQIERRVEQAGEPLGNSSGEPPGELFITLSNLIESIPCYRLRVGRLESMKRLALDVFRESWID